MIAFLQQMFGVTIAVGIILFCLILLWFIVRFSIVSERRTHGWQKRLRQPEVDLVAAHWQLQLPVGLASFYRNSDVIELAEFFLTDSTTSGSVKWFIYKFIPFTIVDLSEWIKITGVPGLPIATGGDDNKSTYYLPFETLRKGLPTPVLLRSPDNSPDIQIASSIEEFIKFQRLDEIYE